MKTNFVLPLLDDRQHPHVLRGGLGRLRCIDVAAKDHLVRDRDGAVLVSVGILVDVTTAYRRGFWPADAAARNIDRWRSRLAEMHPIRNFSET